MKINEVSKLTGVSPRSIRYYEKMGLIKPGRTPSNYRIYTKENINIINRIQIFITAGIPLKTISYIVPCTLHTDRVPMCKDLEALFFSELEKLDERINVLRESKKVLSEIIKNREIVED